LAATSEKPTTIVLDTPAKASHAVPFITHVSMECPGARSILAAVFERLGRYEPAATIAGFAVISYTAMLAEFNTLIAHLRDVLGDQTYESLARKGETMTTAAMATYAYGQIDQARTELEHPS
jgi:hypothetical protein